MGIILNLKKLSLTVLCAVTVISCGGGEPGPYQATGINTGSASGNYEKEDLTAGIPEIGAALQQPFDDDYQAVRFLHRASFGPRLEDIDELSEKGYADWIEEQLQMPASFMLPITRQRTEPRWLEHINSWFKLSVNAPDQLRQRVAYALSQFFVVSGEGELGGQPVALANYYDILIAHSFGNFRDLIEQVTLSPVMGNYLSMKGNQKPDPENNIRPDENYARELLQLFSIGLVQLNTDGSVIADSDGIPLPTYSQEVVESFAHVFTGWHFKNVDDWNYPENEDWFSPMEAYSEHHDKGAKTLLRGRTLPPGQSAEKDLQDALNNIFNHPNVGPFFSRHLITQLVTSNPSSEYINRVATVFNTDANGTRGNIAAVISAILLDDEALNGFTDDPENFGKLREPIVRLVALWRAFEGNPEHPQFDYSWISERLSQAPLQSPSVFNFYSPDFSQPGAIRQRGMRSPEFQIHNESSMISITSALLAHSIWRNTISDSDPGYAPVNISPIMLRDDNVNEQLSYLSKLTLHSPTSNGLRQQALYLLEERSRATSEIRAEELLFLFVSSPEAAVQR